MFGRKLINVIFEWMGVPDFLRADGPPWTEISCAPVRIGESEVLLKIWLGGVNLAVATALLTSGGVELSLPIRLISLRVWKCARHCAPRLRRYNLGAPFGAQVSQIPVASSVISWSIGRIEPGMIFGTNWFLNNFCGNFCW